LPKDKSSGLLLTCHIFVKWSIIRLPMSIFKSRKMHGIMLLIYCLVTALIPLSNIHIEDRPESASYIYSPGQYSDDIHIVLHEAILSHIGNKSEHLSSTAQLQKLACRHSRLNTSKERAKLYAVITGPVMREVIEGFGSIPCLKEKGILSCFCSLSSGLSPPLSA